MNSIRMSWLILTMTLLVSSHSNATVIPSVEQPKFTPIESKQATWVFSGIVSTDNGDNYGYFFQMQRENNHFHAMAALLDEQSKALIFSEDSVADLDELNKPLNWQVGRAFLRFNAINDSWIFGVKPRDHFGFNFKVDMLKQFASQPSMHHLRSGVTMMVTQTSELNGHILTGMSDTEQFVRSNDAWFRQVWQDEDDTKSHAFSHVLCRFNDGSGFYSANLHEPDAQSGAVAGWFNSKGIRQSMSQFIQVAQNQQGSWHIKARSPKMDLAMNAPTQVSSVIAGFVDGTANSGFCMVTPSQKSPIVSDQADAQRHLSP